MSFLCASYQGMWFHDQAVWIPLGGSRKWGCSEEPAGDKSPFGSCWLQHECWGLPGSPWEPAVLRLASNQTGCVYKIVISTIFSSILSLVYWERWHLTDFHFAVSTITWVCRKNNLPFLHCCSIVLYFPIIMQHRLCCLIIGEPS